MEFGAFAREHFRIPDGVNSGLAADIFHKTWPIPAKTSFFMQNFRRLRLQIWSAPLVLNPNTDGNPWRSGGYAGYFDEIRSDFAPV
jgi:hypothetical protein